MEKYLKLRLSGSWISIGLLIISFLLGNGYSLAQTTTGAFVGTITDASGNGVPNVKVTIIEQGTGAQRVVFTNPLGQYTANLLPIGTYTVQAERQGFKSEALRNIPLQVNQTVREDIRLQVGSETQTVQVTAAVPLVKTDASDTGAVIGATEVVELPLNGRNFLQLASLAAGAFPLAHVDGVMQLFGGGIISNGADSNANQITLDSVENQDYLIPRVGITPSPDAIAEFKVMTGDYGAEYGRASGANINVLLKSGTNEFHGDVYEFLRNNAFDARNFFQKGSLPPFRQNQFGGTFGGPIVKNKLFFFGSYDGFRQVQGLTVNAILPTAAQRGGDFSSGPAIFDPLTTTTNPVTGQVTRSAFTGNIIPTNRISPTAVKALNLLYPAAQQQIPNVFNSIFNPNLTDNSNQYIARIDYDPNEKNRIWGHFAYNNNPELEPIDNSTGLPGQGTFLGLSQMNDVIGYTRTISPTIVNDIRIGYNRYNQNLYTQAHNQNIIGQIGIQGALDDPATWGPPNINITGMTSVGAFQFAPSHPITNDFEFLDTLSLVKGGHSIKLGADIRRGQMNGRQFPNARGVYNFGTGQTNDPQNQSTTGQGLASFLLGYVSSDSLTLGSTDNDIRTVNGGFFVQDDWTIRRDLTLNLGLRYDYMPQPVSAKNRIANWDQADQVIVLSQNNLNAPTACAGCGGAPLGVILQSFNGIFNFKTRSEVGWPRSLVQSDYHDFSPRIGFAWRILGSDKTVLRGAWGRFYEITAGNVVWNFTDNPPYSHSLGFTANPLQVPTITLTNPFPATSVQGAPGLTGGALYNWADPYNDNWNITLQRQLRNNTSVQLGYVGTDGVGQPMGVNFNSTKFGILSTQQLVPNPQYGSVTIDAPWGRSWYNSLQATLETHAKSLSILANYTWANSLTEGGGGINQGLDQAFLGWNFFGYRTPLLTPRLSPNDIYLRIDKGPSGLDLNQRLSISYVWDLPFGRGRRVNLTGPLDWVAGGWELSGITTAESGFHLPAAYAQGNRPNRVGDPSSGAPHTISEWFNTSAFAPTLSTLFVYNNNLNPLLAEGNAGRAPIIGPGLQNWDLGIYKNFPFKERYRVQFRAELFNAFNNVNFGDPSTTLGTATFGHISSAAAAREVQFALKFYF